MPSPFRMCKFGDSEGLSLNKMFHDPQKMLPTQLKVAAIGVT